MEFLQNLKVMTLGGEKTGTIDFNQLSLYSRSGNTSVPQIR